MLGATDFVIKHGYAVLFVGALADQLGLPVPAIPFLIAAGALARLGKINLLYTLALVVAASLISDFCWFYLGKRRGALILKLLCGLSLEPGACTSRTQATYARFGARSILVAKFVPGLDTITPPMAGLFKLAPWKFLMLDFGAAVLWAGGYIGLGWVFRTELDKLALVLQRFGKWMGIALLAGLAAYIAPKCWRLWRAIRALRVGRITPQELKQRMDAGKSPMIVDLRDAIERTEGEIPTSIQLTDITSLVVQGSKIEVVLYCSSAYEFVSARAALKLQRLGVSRVCPLQGGFPLWRELGFPVQGGMISAVPSLTREAASS